MEPDKMHMEDLLADESFLNYCKNSSPADVAFWEAYIIEYPERRLLVEYSKARFVALFNAFANADLAEQELRLRNRLDMIEPANVVQMEGFKSKRPDKKLSTLLKVIAAAAVLLTVVFLNIKNHQTSDQKGVKIFQAAYGERKNIQLPDGSDVALNSGSKIEINGSFGAATRDVYLEGEAFFDVKHNARLPFIVHTPAMDVKALGTAFDVKAYRNEKTTETSLIRGLVEVTLKEGNNRKMLLYPNQKIKWEYPFEKAVTNAPAAKNGGALNAADSLLKKLVKTDHGDIKEIAWKENKLIFENELMGDIALLLERWYGIKINFKDDAIRNYRFTGIFEKEDLHTVLDILKESRGFNYKVEPGETLSVTLSK